MVLEKVQKAMNALVTCRSPSLFTVLKITLDYYYIFLDFFFPDHHNYKYYATICYGDYLDISCNYGRPPAISILKAEFGRNSPNRCPITSGQNRLCGQHSVTNLVKTR